MFSGMALKLFNAFSWDTVKNTVNLLLVFRSYIYRTKYTILLMQIFAFRSPLWGQKTANLVNQ